MPKVRVPVPLLHRQRRGVAASQAGRLLLGAAIGTGMTAKAAERGGADFLLALSAGRCRSMGLPSVASLLALHDSNAMVMEFGAREILTQTSLPVFFGASTFGIGEFTQLLDQIIEAGFHGITNFPSCIFLDGRYRRSLEEAGQGFDRELALLRAASAAGLSTLAYAHTLHEACCAARADVDIVNLNLGWNMGGEVGVESTFGLEEASNLARQFVGAIRKINTKTRCLIEGGPIVTPEQMDQVCKYSDADGYIGGSTIDRVPLESAIEMATGAFKTIGALRKQVDALERKLHRKLAVPALMGFSDPIERAREQTAQAMETNLPLLIIGEPGTGRREIARIVHEARLGKGRLLSAVECKADAAQMERILFGCVKSAASRPATPCKGLLEMARGSTLMLDDVGNLDFAIQRQLLQAAQSGEFRPGDGAEIVPLDVRFIGISRLDAAAESNAERFDAGFLRWLGAMRIELPPLRERLEDLPMLAEAMVRDPTQGEKIRLEPSAYRALLSHSWPGNLSELRSVLRAAASGSRRGTIGERDLTRSLASRQRAASDRKSFSSEREWILDGLKRNRFRRAETARFLRIARKTLYNKMRQYGLSGEGVFLPRARRRHIRKP